MRNILLAAILLMASFSVQASITPQDYAEVRMTPIEARRLQRWHTVLAQPKVRKALARVGRIEHFNLESPQK